jgi:hypothetical protein
MPVHTYGTGQCPFFACESMRPKRRFWTAERIFKATFKDASPKSSTHVCEKCFENTFRNVRSAVQNLRLEHILERIFKALFKERSPNRVLVCEKCFENKLPNVSSTVRNLRLGCIEIQKTEYRTSHNRTALDERCAILHLYAPQTKILDS